MRIRPSLPGIAILCWCAWLLAVSTATAANKPAPPPKLDKQERKTLSAMKAASTWGHPDLYGQFTGMRAYGHGNYKKALKYFRYGAKYADKLSQLSIGLLYLNGRGVHKDPAKAWGWLAVAAERGYPKFVATRDRVWSQLDHIQRIQAHRDRKRIAAQYGDKVAKRRMRHALEYWKTQMTGSHIGFNSGIQHWSPDPTRGAAACAQAQLLSAPIAGCPSSDIYARWRWDPKTYFEVKDARWTGTVTVGDLESGDKNAQSGHHPKPAPALSTH